MRKIKTDFEDVKTKWLPSVMAIAELNNLTSDIRLIQLQHAFATTTEGKQRYERIMLNILEQITENQDRYEPLISDSLEQNVYTEFEDQWGRYVELWDEFVDFSRVNENIKAVDLLNAESLDVWNAFNSNLEQLIEINKNGSYDAAERAEKAFISTRNVSIILLIITVILSITLAGALVRFISEPVRQLVRAAKKVAEGRFQPQNKCLQQG